MAITKVQGAVTRTFFDGKGAEVTESWQQGGETRTRKWAAFFEEPHGLSEGDQIEVSGMHGDKIDEWEKDGETRRTVKRTLNRARLTTSDVQGAQEPQDAPEGDPGESDAWTTAAIPVDDAAVPF